MAISFNDNIFNKSPKDQNDKTGVFENGVWRPYVSINEALANPKLNIAYRNRGLTIYILKAGILTEYWWRDGIADNLLVEKDSVIDLSDYYTKEEIDEFNTTFSSQIANKQNQLNGTGFIKASGTTISYDNTVYAPLISPVFSGVPRANTAILGTSTTQIATTEFVQNALTNLGAGTVTNVSSINSDILVANQSTTPILTLNSGTAANQIVKRDSSGNIIANQFLGNATTATSTDQWAGQSYINSNITEAPAWLMGYRALDNSWHPVSSTFVNEFLNLSYPVNSVFGRQGDIVAQESDYSTFFNTKAEIITLDNTNVKLTGNQTIGGLKTFMSFITTPSLFFSNTAVGTNILEVQSISGTASLVWQDNIGKQVRLKHGSSSAIDLIFPSANGTLARLEDLPNGSSFIQNQNSSDQTANFRINGIGVLSRVGLGSITTPHQLTIAAANIGVDTSPGIGIFTTTDQVTNYEKLRIFGNSTSFNISSEASGTGIQRTIVITAPRLSISNRLSINQTPLTSSDSYDIITRNTSNGEIERISSSILSSYELLSNKSTTTTLGTSNTLYPTQNAVKVYVDNSLASLPTPTLQQVTSAGSTTTTTITSSQNIASRLGLVGEGTEIKSTGVGFIGSAVSNLVAADRSVSRTWTLPATTGTIALTSDIPTLTASNGLNRSGNDIRWGGTLSSDTDVIIGTNNLSIRADPLGGRTGAYLNMGNPLDGANNIVWSLSAFGSVGSFGGQLQEIFATQNVMIVNDSRNGIGLQNAADYSANWNPRSLVDKAYVDRRTSSIVEISGTSASMNPGIVYILHSTSLTTLTLPVLANIGDLIQIIGEGSGGFKVAQNTSQYIASGNMNTTTGTSGYIQTTANNTFVSLRYVNTNKWMVSSSNQAISVV